MKNKQIAKALTVGAVIGALVAVLTIVGLQLASTPEASESFVVKATNVEQAAELVRKAGGTVTQELHSIHAVRAQLTSDQVRELLRSSVVRIYPDRQAELTAGLHVTHRPEKS